MTSTKAGRPSSKDVDWLAGGRQFVTRHGRLATIHIAAAGVTACGYSWTPDFRVVDQAPRDDRCTRCFGNLGGSDNVETTYVPLARQAPDEAAAARTGHGIGSIFFNRGAARRGIE